MEMETRLSIFSNANLSFAIVGYSDSGACGCGCILCKRANVSVCVRASTIEVDGNIQPTLRDTFTSQLWLYN